MPATMRRGEYPKRAPKSSQPVMVRESQGRIGKRLHAAEVKEKAILNLISESECEGSSLRKKGSRLEEDRLRQLPERKLIESKLRVRGDRFVLGAQHLFLAMTLRQFEAVGSAS